MKTIFFVILCLVVYINAELPQQWIYGPPPTPQDPLATTEKDSEIIDERARKLNEISVKPEKLQAAPENGVYYIYHPSGLLQKVSYTTEDNVKQMAFAAKLKYENVEPISGPVYTYDPNTYVFKKLQ